MYEDWLESQFTGRTSEFNWTYNKYQSAESIKIKFVPKEEEKKKNNFLCRDAVRVLVELKVTCVCLLTAGPVIRTCTDNGVHGPS